MLFSEHLKEEAQPILAAIHDHPFVVGIGEGQLPREALQFYIEQDTNYLKAFAKVYAAAIMKCDNKADMAFFSEQIDLTLHSEVTPHQLFSEVAAIDYEAHTHADLAPTAYLYNEHMYNAAREGSLLDIVASLAPCPWTYEEIAVAHTVSGKNEATNPFAKWIDFYHPNMGEESATAKLFYLLDREAAQANEAAREKAKQRFLRSCELEWHFWEMAYHQIDWRFSAKQAIK